jgi:hypothetical protein
MEVIKTIATGRKSAETDEPSWWEAAIRRIGHIFTE